MRQQKIRKKTPISNRDRVRNHRKRKALKNSMRISQQILIDGIQREVTQTATDQPNLRTKIRNWASQYKISKNAIDKLLAVLVSSGIQTVPKNHRTLQKTPTNIEIKNVAGGLYWYNGLGKCLRQIFSNIDKDIEISLNINMDGLPLFKSSTTTFWPILAAIHGMYHYLNDWLLCI